MTRDSKTCRVLVVDDEVIVALGLCANLEHLGYLPLGPATTGEQALTIAEQEHPDLVLMDVALVGDMDGVQTAGKLNRDRVLPVCFVSGYPARDILDRTTSLPVVGVLEKPITIDALKAILEKGRPSSCGADRPQ